ncbi:hypothetical protein Cgig2_032384 [Carnegiea gigantea]|uniref:Uncharacterized protein n=1 Tax=Carnegiea gigantea TaxID=171969 RepID=A0A9Q1JJY9_9CARY|nr:hypothetical protein Cgig2_032384 [Carnegiea gigantea]
MGWFWRDDDESDNSSSGHMAEFRNPNPNAASTDRCSTRRIVQTKCNTEEVEPAVVPDNYCVNRPTEIVQSNKEYTEDDVTDEVMKGTSTLGSSNVRPFDFPGLRSDIEAMERSISGGINRFFEAADEMRNDFFHVFNDSSLFGRGSSSSSRRRIIPFEDDIQGKPDAKANGSDSGSLDIPSLARDPFKYKALTLLKSHSSELSFSSTPPLTPVASSPPTQFLGRGLLHAGLRSRALVTGNEISTHVLWPSTQHCPASAAAVPSAGSAVKPGFTASARRPHAKSPTPSSARRPQKHATPRGLRLGF